jgi:lysozyme family protein
VKTALTIKTQYRTSNNLDVVIAGILVSEGPEINEDPPNTPPGQGEPVGISKYGVSLTAYGDFCKTNSLPVPTKDDIRNLTSDGATKFYTWFLGLMRFNDLPSGVDYRLADIATNDGITGAIRIMGVALGIYPVPTTLTDDAIAIIKIESPEQMIAALGGIWIGQKMMEPNFPKYGHGWNVRRVRVDLHAQTMVGQ